MKFKLFYRYLRRRVATREKIFEESLERKRIERQTNAPQIPYTHCKNCGTELYGIYCHKCGQYANAPKQQFWNHIIDFFSNTYYIDGKILRTIWLLFRKPGYLTNEFLQGKVKSYVHPMKLNMFLLLIVTIVFAFSISSKKTKAQIDTIAEYDEMTIDVVSASNSYNTDTLTIDTSKRLIDNSILRKSDGGYYTFVENKNTHNDKSKSKGLEREMFFSFYQSYLPISIILISPILALLLWGLNARKKCGFTTHFIFSLHYSASLEFVAFLFLLLTNLFAPAFVFWCTLILIAVTIIYCASAITTVYKGTPLHTAIWKAIVINATYLTFVFAVSFALLIAFIVIRK